MQEETCNAQAVQAVWQRALVEDSNRELDWLWLYTQVDTNEQRQISLQKALHINCHNEQTRRMLAALERARELADAGVNTCPLGSVRC